MHSEALERAAAAGIDEAGYLKMVQAAIADCRVKIRNGDEDALWYYVRMQWDDPVLDDFQKDIVRSGTIGRYAEIAIKGCTGPGKGFAVAVLMNVIFDVWPETKIVLTSSDLEQAKTVMFGEILAVRQAMFAPEHAKVMTEEFKGQIAIGTMSKNRRTGKMEPEYKDNPKKYLRVANPKTGEGMSGAHGAFSVFLADEASSVVDDLYDNAKQWARLIVTLSNPRVLSGWFFDMFRPAADPDETQTITCERGRRRLITIGGQDCRNVREKRLKTAVGPLGGIDIRGRHFEQGEMIPDDFYVDVKPIIPNQTCFDQFSATMASTDEFVRRVLGEGRFPKEDAQTQLFLQSWFERHRAAWKEIGGQVPVEAFGLDIAATAHGDATVLSAGGMAGLRKQHDWKKADTVQTIGEVLRVANDEYGIDLKEGRIPIGIDNSGLGKSVCDMLEDLGCNVVRVSGQGSPKSGTDIYANRRAEVYGELARRISPIDTPLLTFALPTDPMLEQELCSHHKIILGRGFRITPKDRHPGQSFQGHTIREHLGRSPDRSDSLCYLFAAVVTLEGGCAPTLNRPLILLTEQEQLAASLVEMALLEAETDEQKEKRLAKEQHDELARVLGWEDAEEVADEVPFPSFL